MADLDANAIAEDAKGKLKTLLVGAGLTEEMAAIAANNSVANCFAAIIEAITDAIEEAGGVGGGGGDVVGPSSATDNALARFDGGTGKALQSSSAILTDAGWLTVVKLIATGELDVTGATITGLSASEVGADAVGTAAAAVAAHVAAGDPHTQYLTEAAAPGLYVARDGSGSLTAHWNVGGYKLQGLATGTGTDDAATYGQLVSMINGLDWQDSVLSQTSTPPGGPSTGDRYLIGASATGAWSGHDEKIAEWNGSTWDFVTPTKGATVHVDAAGTDLTYNGSHPAGSWVNIGVSVDHASLLNRAWTASSHTGTATRLAGFDGSGAPGYYQIGVDVQAWDAKLDGIAALTPAGGDGLVWRASLATWVAVSVPSDALYGLGVDGNVVFDGSASVVIDGQTIAPVAGVYTFTRNCSINTATVSGGAVIRPAGFDVFIRNMDVVSGSSAIHEDGNSAVAGTGGAALSYVGSYYNYSTQAGANGRASNGAGISTGARSDPCVGGRGGAGGASGAGNAGGTAGTVGWSSRAAGGTPWHPANIWGWANKLLSGWTLGSGGGSGGKSGAGTSGAGGGSAGFVRVYIGHLRIRSGATLRVSANGGAGSDASVGATNCGGGGGGGGGLVMLVTGSRDIDGTLTVTANGGAAGLGVGGGVDGVAGSAGYVVNV